MAHLDEHKFLSDKQHAFRKWHSCETQLATLINEWANILNNKGQVNTSILDFEKAFDTPHMNSLKVNCLVMELVVTIGYNKCSLITESEFDSVENTSCTWICPKCVFFNFSDSFFADQLNLENDNRFDPLANGSGTKASKTGSDKNKFITGLKFVSITSIV